MHSPNQSVEIKPGVARDLIGTISGALIAIILVSGTTANRSLEPELILYSLYCLKDPRITGSQCS